MNPFKSLLATLGLVACGPSESQAPLAMKEISYRGGLVRFQVPHDWVEEYEPDGGGMFYADGPDTGTLRLSIITAESPVDLPQDEPVRILKAIRAVDPDKIRRLANGNAIAEYIQHSSEDGTEITLYWWSLTSAVRPRHVRVANFSYTVRRVNADSANTLAEVDMLRNSIEAAQFHPELGETGAIH